ncbi:MAG TPA: hypothetical protein PKE44_13015, partial [Plasticicumulans sp.]|nr:hypothetical protein [Plasticicumulans sp.]
MLPHPALPPRVPTPQPRLAAGAPLRWLRAGWQVYRHTAAASSLATALPVGPRSFVQVLDNEETRSFVISLGTVIGALFVGVSVFKPV